MRKFKINFLSRFEHLSSRHLPHNSLRRALVSGAFWSVSGAAVLRGLSLLATIIVARLLGKHVYGQWGVIMGVASLFGSLGGLGMATAASKYVAELKTSDFARAGAVLYLILGISLLGVSATSVACLALSKWMAHSLYNAPELFVPLMLSSIMLFCIMGNLILQGIMAGFEDFRAITWISIIQGIILFVGLVLLTYWLGLVGATIGMTISQGIGMCLYLVAIFKLCRQHNIRIRKRGVRQELRLIWHYAAPGFLTSSILHPANTLSQALVANTQGGFSGLGGFNASARWRELIQFVPRAAKRITLPMLSKLQGQQDYKRFRKALWANVALNGGIALAVALPIIVASRWILRLYGPDFTRDWDIMVILIIMGVSQSVLEVLAQVMACMEKMWWNFGFHIVYGTIILGGSYLLVPKHGVRGFVWSYAIATTIHLLNHIAGTAILLRGQYRNATAEPTNEKVAH